MVYAVYHLLLSYSELFCFVFFEWKTQFAFKSKVIYLIFFCKDLDNIIQCNLWFSVVLAIIYFLTDRQLGGTKVLGSYTDKDINIKHSSGKIRSTYTKVSLREPHTTFWCNINWIQSWQVFWLFQVWVRCHSSSWPSPGSLCTWGNRRFPPQAPPAAFGPLPHPVGLRGTLGTTCFHRPPCRELCVREESFSDLGLGPVQGLRFPMSHTGMSRLIELCRSPSERNSSDAVLVACLVSSQPSPRFLSGFWDCRPGARKSWLCRGCLG